MLAYLCENLSLSDLGYHFRLHCLYVMAHTCYLHALMALVRMSGLLPFTSHFSQGFARRLTGARRGTDTC